MRVRFGRRTDLPAIAAIEAASFPHPWPSDLLAAYLDDEGTVVLVAEEGSPIGFLIACRERAAEVPVFHIHDLAVAPPHRRRGAASALLGELMRIAVAERIALLRLEVRIANEAARRFYERWGFRPTRRLGRYYEDGGDALRMELDLHPRQS
ncbi:MAG: ribosomal protein S18-alanine N-acetyltransferase [Candidatus Bipolaricaulota bacterium]|nr:GNAT family N-acetyltransferase [Candidatus Bipolaricaulota bacterium]